MHKENHRSSLCRRRNWEGEEEIQTPACIPADKPPVGASDLDRDLERGSSATKLAGEEEGGGGVGPRSYPLRIRKGQILHIQLFCAQKATKKEKKKLVVFSGPDLGCWKGEKKELKAANQFDRNPTKPADGESAGDDLSSPRGVLEVRVSGYLESTAAAAVFRPEKRGDRTAVLWSPNMETLGCRCWRADAIVNVWDSFSLEMESEPSRCFSLTVAGNWKLNENKICSNG
ncbi:hypothetical protein U1Q18_013278 [Sarracenia purpurea var. burkii]